MRLPCAVALLLTSCAALAPSSTQAPSTKLHRAVGRRELAATVAAAAFVVPTTAFAASPPGGFKAPPIEAPTSKININTAQAAQYTDCPGMYPTIASRIVEHVRYEGRFKKVSDLYEAEDIIQGNDNIKAVIKRNEARLVVN